MNSQIVFIVGMLTLAFAGTVGSEPGAMLLGYEQSGTVESIDRSTGIIRIDGQVYLLPRYLPDRSRRPFDADVGVEYRVGDRVGYTVSLDNKNSSLPRLSVLWLLTS